MKQRTGFKGDDALSSAFEEMKGQNDGYLSERRYVGGWTHGSKGGLAKICLLWCDGHGKRGVDRHDFEHYFFIRTEDTKGRGGSLLRRLRDGVTDRRRSSAVRRWEPDPVYPEWTRVYVDIPPRYFFTRAHVLIGEHRFVDDLRIEGRDRHVDLTSPSLLVFRKLEAAGIKTYEGDLHPMRRFVADHPIRYPTASEYAECYFDIEVDDRHDDLFENLGRYRILSMAGVDKLGEEFFYLLDEETDDAERSMLKEFLRDLDKKWDTIFAWNGSHFDFYYLYERCRRLGIKWKWWRVVPVDLLQVFKRYHFRAGAKASSYALDKISGHVLGDECPRKVDLAGRLDELHPGWRTEDGSHVGTWSAWFRAPDLLREYNLQDCRMLKALEEATGYAHLDFTFSQIGNCFADDFNVSTKIDGLMIRKALVDGIHFPSVDRQKRWQEREETGYEGGYVHEPTRGIHRSVCAFDFKSLYPSMIQTFNISPDTWVSAFERDGFPESALITTPIGSTFTRPVKVGDEWTGVGFIPQMFAETLHKRAKYQDAQAEVEVGSSEFLHYYRLAYAYKRLGLSFYGELGNWRGRYYNPEIARSVTLSGQHFMRETIDIAEAASYPALYGDTDSIYLSMKADDGEAFVERCHAIYATWLEAWNAPPELCTVYLEFEDVYAIVCLVAKKRYFGRMIKHKGKEANHLEIKGFEVMRSDGTALARNLQRDVMDLIAMQEKGADEVWAIVNAERDRVLGGKVDVADLTETKGLSKRPSQYKTSTPHVRVVEEMRDKGQEWHVGMKVPYVWIVGTYLPIPKRDPDLSFRENLEALEAWRLADAVKAKRSKLPPKPRPIYAPDYDPEATPYDAPFYWSRKVYPASQRIVEVAFPLRDWRSLNNEQSGKATRKLATFRKGLLDPKRRAAYVEKIQTDANLNARDRADLARYYIQNVISPSGG